MAHISELSQSKTTLLPGTGLKRTNGLIEDDKG